MQKTSRIGEKKINTYSSLMTIIEYKDCNNIIVEFENGYKVKSRYNHFQNGKIKSPYDKTVYGVGCIGEGEYRVKDENGNITIQYNYWHSMLQRCYDEKYKSKRPTYEDKYVCEEWLNYQNFAKWFDENYYECNDGYVMDLDKDILFKGNKVYSPDNCVFVSHRINTLFTKRNILRGEYPIGVSEDKCRFRARCSVFDEYKNKFTSINLGYFNTPEEAFEKYKTFKENYIKEVADKYKEQIPEKLYKAMYDYIVEIND